MKGVKYLIPIMLLMILVLEGCENTDGKWENATMPEVKSIQFHLEMDSAKFKDFVLLKDSIYALSDQNELISIDYKYNLKTRYDTNIVAIAKWNNHILVGALGNGEVRTWKTGETESTLIGNYEGELSHLLTDSKGSIYTISKYGIQRIGNPTVYFDSVAYNTQLRFKDHWTTPSVAVMDHNDHIWLGFVHGEWGGDLRVFDTKKNIFKSLNLTGFDIELNPVNSLVEMGEKMYVLCGLHHFMTYGEIVELKDYKAKILLSSESREEQKASKHNDFKAEKGIEGLYIGPGAYAGNKLYFYSQKGIYRGNPKEDLSIEGNWEPVFKPQLTWEGSQQLAIGSPMNVLKMKCAQNKIIFLSQNEGIGVFDEKTNKLKMYN